MDVKQQHYKSGITVKFHRINLIICSHFKEGETPSNSQIKKVVFPQNFCHDLMGFFCFFLQICRQLLTAGLDKMFTFAGTGFEFHWLSV